MNTLLLSLALAAGAVQASTEPDGLDLITVTTAPGSPCALRLVVRAGANHDPSGKAGLAHTVKHLITGTPGFGLLRHDAGGALYTATLPTVTVFELTVSAGRCAAGLDALLSAVSGPPLTADALEQARRNISAEAPQQHSPHSSALERLLVPASSELLFGTQGTRSKLTVQDTQRFFEEHYHPANMALVVVSPLGADEVRAVTGALRLPPSTRYDKVTLTPPARLSTRQGLTPKPGFSLAAVNLQGNDRSCEALAALVTLQLLAAAPNDALIATTCVLLEGDTWLQVTAHGTPGAVSALGRRAAALLAAGRLPKLSKPDEALLAGHLAANEPGNAEQLATQLSWLSRSITGEALAVRAAAVSGAATPGDAQAAARLLTKANLLFVPAAPGR